MHAAHDGIPVNIQVRTTAHSAVFAMWAGVCMHHVLAGQASMEREGRNEEGQCIAAIKTGEYVD